MSSNGRIGIGFLPLNESSILSGVLGISYKSYVPSLFSTKVRWISNFICKKIFRIVRNKTSDQLVKSSAVRNLHLSTGMYLWIHNTWLHPNNAEKEFINSEREKCTYIWCVKDLPDLHNIGDVPGVFSECPQRQSIFPNKAGGEVGQSFFLTSRRDPLLKTVKEDLGGMKD